MKTTGYGGTSSLILNQPNFTLRPPPRSPFPRRPGTFGGFTIWVAASGHCYLAVNWALKSGTNYTYMFFGPATFAACQKIDLNQVTNPFGNISQPCLGLFYNYSDRPFTFDKVPLTSITAWLAAH